MVSGQCDLIEIRRLMWPWSPAWSLHVTCGTVFATLGLAEIFWRPLRTIEVADDGGYSFHSSGQ